MSEKDKAAELRARIQAEGDEIERRSFEREKSGYGQPPVDSRFKKGRSGNPRGRPPKSERAFSARQTTADVLRAGEDELEIVSEGRKVRVSAIQVILKKLHIKAAQGDFRSAKLVLELRRGAIANTMFANKRLHDLLELMEGEAVMKGHLPPSHHIFTDLQRWRKRTRKL